MFFPLAKIFGKKLEEQVTLSKDSIAKLLKTTPEALAAFEEAYRVNVLEPAQDSENFFDINAKQAASMRPNEELSEQGKELNDRIIAELIAQTSVLDYNGETLVLKTPDEGLSAGPAVTLAEINSIPESIRPQLSGTLMKRDVSGDTAATLLYQYKYWQEARIPKIKQVWYNMFRQGLDMLDLDGLTYEILGMNKNAMGYWLPALVAGVKQQSFFKIPKTKIIKVPITMLQLTRTDYELLTPGTMDVVNRFCQQIFELDESKSYFIKTGTYSSKFDFRNAKVTGAKEVRELGEYLLFIQHQAQMMAAPLANPRIYGVSTTNEWVVREFIEDSENSPCIYKGLPLRTEYRVFVDLDKKQVIGMNPYWDPDVMKQRFGHEDDADSPHQMHDYVIYRMHEEQLMARYNENAATVKNNIRAMLPEMAAAGLTGQWSIDVMQNGNDFYVIDMALAQNSALINCVPKHLLKPTPENWLPELPPTKK